MDYQGWNRHFSQIVRKVSFRELFDAFKSATQTTLQAKKLKCVDPALRVFGTGPVGSEEWYGQVQPELRTIGLHSAANAIKNADRLEIDGLASAIRVAATKARDGTATRDDLTGSTITMTSLGKLGGIVSTPVINAPELSIIGVNKAVHRPMVIDGRVEIRLMMNLSSSFDHRFIDGFDAASMIQVIKSLLEEPALLFIPA